jgi:CubicO group peptidase (beta-lactamase class C family)
VIRPEALREVDAIFDRFLADGPAPGIAYGVVAGGELVHERGLGTVRAGEARPPDANSVFRIASMTKSFTAAAIILLREEGRLGLDESVATYVPDLAGLRGPTRDSPALTVRHLLTHTGGFATDDPWGDRQQGLDLAAFAALLRGGPTFAFAPGTRFEYSNLGYGILGRVVTYVAGVEYRDFVYERLLVPLGMTSTGYVADDVPPDRLARGHVKRDGAWIEEPLDGYGALAAMGGIFTSIRDLARWVGFFSDAYPPRDDDEGDSPLSRASRREMQMPHSTWPPDVTFERMTSEPNVGAMSYGYGLTIIQDLGIGTVVAHGGGYPGFGSNMRWHPASGLGVVALGNARYVNLSLPARDSLRALVRADSKRGRRIRPWPATATARRDVEQLVVEWDDEIAARLFAMNVELDEPLARRKATLERLRALHGRLTPDDSEPSESESPAHLSWWLAGERGCVRIEMRLSPEPTPRVQTLDVTSIPEPSTTFHDAAQAIVEALADPRPPWPAEIGLGPAIDRANLERELRAAAARFETPSLGRCIAGDGEKKATWRVTSPNGTFELRLERDPGANVLTAVALVPKAIRAPYFAD